jgi:hypothetical protein
MRIDGSRLMKRVSSAKFIGIIICFLVIIILFAEITWAKPTTPEQTSVVSSTTTGNLWGVDFVGRAQIFPDVIFSDDFNDNNIDANKWTYGGDPGYSVVEEGGIMKIEAGESFYSILSSMTISINRKKPIIIQRLLNLGESYYISLIQYDNYFLRVEHNSISELTSFAFNYNKDYLPMPGNLFNNKDNYSTQQYSSTYSLLYLPFPPPGVWVTEMIIYNPVTGLAQYFIDSELRDTFNIGILPANINKIRLDFESSRSLLYWDGSHSHMIYQYLDDIIVRQNKASTVMKPAIACLLL